MATEKVSLTLDADILAQARTDMGERGLSAHVNEMLRRQQQQTGLLALLDDLDEQFGALSAAEMHAALAERRRIEEQWLRDGI